MLDNLRTYIIAQSSNFTTSNVFLDDMPPKPNECVTIFRDEGEEVSEARYLAHTPVTFHIRHSSYANAEAWCEEIVGLLHDKQNIDSTLKYVEKYEGIIHYATVENYYILSFSMMVSTLQF